MTLVTYIFVLVLTSSNVPCDTFHVTLLTPIVVCATFPAILVKLLSQGAPGGERFVGIIGGPHHDADMLLAVRGQGKLRPGREDQRARRGE